MTITDDGSIQYVNKSKTADDSSRRIHDPLSYNDPLGVSEKSPKKLDSTKSKGLEQEKVTTSISTSEEKQ